MPDPEQRIRTLEEIGLVGASTTLGDELQQNMFSDDLTTEV